MAFASLRLFFGAQSLVLRCRGCRGCGRGQAHMVAEVFAAVEPALAVLPERVVRADLVVGAVLVVARQCRARGESYAADEQGHDHGGDDAQRERMVPSCPEPRAAGRAWRDRLCVRTGGRMVGAEPRCSALSSCVIRLRHRTLRAERGIDLHIGCVFPVCPARGGGFYYQMSLTVPVLTPLLPEGRRFHAQTATEPATRRR